MVLNDLKPALATRLYHRARFRDTKRELNYYCSALFLCCLGRIRTLTGGTRIRRATITPQDNSCRQKPTTLGCFGFAIAKLRRNIVSCKYLRPFFYFFYQQTKYQHNIQTPYFFVFYTQYTQTANHPYFDSHMTCIFVYFT